MTHEQFLEQFTTFQQQSLADGRFIPRPADFHEILDDDRPKHDEKDLSFDYWAHCAIAARYVAKRMPRQHVDIGSYAYFAGLVSAFVESFIFVDLRPLPWPFPNLSSVTADARHLPFDNDSIESMSCLHVIEHIGLGRYGDEIDAEGDRKAAREMIRCLKPGGQLVIVAPMCEKPKVTFNSDRYYSAVMLNDLFAPLKRTEFSYILGAVVPFTSVPSNGEIYTGIAAYTK